MNRLRACALWRARHKAHNRRYFFAARESDPERANWALERIRDLFLLERAAARAKRSERQRLRQEKSKPIVDAFFQWCEQQRDRVLDGSPMADAIRYALNQREALGRFLDDARLPLSNNISERNLRRQATGRKNWVFVGSEDGARANTTFVSLLAPDARHRAVGLPARPVLFVAELVELAGPRAGARVLATSARRA